MTAIDVVAVIVMLCLVAVGFGVLAYSAIELSVKPLLIYIVIVAVCLVTFYHLGQ